MARDAALEKEGGNSKREGSRVRPRNKRVKVASSRSTDRESAVINESDGYRGKEGKEESELGSWRIIARKKNYRTVWGIKALRISKKRGSAHQLVSNKGE